MQVEVPDADVEALADVIDCAIEQYGGAKDHLLECPSVESPEMLLEVVADYDERRTALVRIRTQLGETK